MISILQSPLSLPPIWRESRAPLEAASLLRSDVFRGDSVRNGRGQPVLLIPGFLAGDGSLGLMTGWLRRTGHHTRKSGMRANIDCSARAIERLAEPLRQLAERSGQRVAIIGQSRGGNFAKVLASRHPELVSGVVALGSPQLDPYAVHPLVAAQVFSVGTLGTLGMRGLFRRSCRFGSCCTSFWEDLRGPLREDVDYVCVYSRSDGIVEWRACLDPHARHVEIDSSHIGMAVHPSAFGAVATALDGFRIRERERNRNASRRGIRGGARVRRAA